MITFETKRCRIRNFMKKDISSLMTYRNDEKWMRFQGFKGLTSEEYEEILLKNSTLEEGIQLVISKKTTDKIIGDFYVKKTNDSFMIGYTISPLYARQGYTYEATIGLIEWIKSTGVKKIYGTVMKENHASKHLLEKLNFKFVEINEDDEEVWAYIFR